MESWGSLVGKVKGIRGRKVKKSKELEEVKIKLAGNYLFRVLLIAPSHRDQIIDHQQSIIFLFAVVRKPIDNRSPDDTK